jgi:hypothetical protein
VKEGVVGNSAHHKGVVWHQNGEDMVIEEMKLNRTDSQLPSNRDYKMGSRPCGPLTSMC